jgi:hypothetical protein|nr:MAG TPA: protein-turn-helix DNA binding protein [Caudoviricetes sp.]
MKNTVIRDNSRIENVDFTKLDKILNKKGIRRAELSRRCGYCSTYVKDIVFRQKKLNWTVANMLERVYGISLDEYCYEKTETVASNNDTQPKEVINPVDVQPKFYKFDPSEYFDTQPKEVTNPVNDDMYTFTLSVNGKLLKKIGAKIYRREYHCSGFRV